MTHKFYFAELHIGSSIRYENALFGNYFHKCYIVKIILISFNCFSEYISYFGNILYNKASVLRFSSSNCSVLSATMSSRLLVYRSIMAIMLSTTLVFLQFIIEIYHVNYGKFSSYIMKYRSKLLRYW